MAKKYRCPYCKDTYERNKLVEHIEVEHEDMIPEGFTPARVVFAVINHKDHGVCVVCKKNTNWDEDRGKYERLCSNPNCRKKLREVALKNHMKVYKVPTLLNDEEHQEKMLSHRKIAGEYTFSDGGKLGYVGTFEHKLLEFFDLVLKVKSKDILEPGPVLEYDFHGKVKKWITDFLYIPYNLVIEVKDGGDNPNKRQMPEYRDKQLQKEKMITNLGTYNYLRLTNNNFAQLLGIFAEMKEQMIDDTKENAKAIVRIYEAVSFVNKSSGIYYRLEGDEDTMKNNIPFGITEEAFVEQLKFEASEAGEDLEKLEAFYQKYKRYVDAYEEKVFKEEVEYSKLTEEEKEKLATYVPEEGDITDEELDAMSDDELDVYMKQNFKSSPMSIIVGTINGYRFLQGKPWLGETKDD